MIKKEKNNVFAERLSQLLEMKNISQAELARRAGLSKSTISHYVKGDWKGKQEAVYSIATALNCRVEWLQGYDDWMQDVPSGGSVEDLVERLLHEIGYYFDYENSGSKIYMEKTKGGFVPRPLMDQGIIGGRVDLSDKQALITNIIAAVELHADKLLRKGLEYELRKKIEELDSNIKLAKETDNRAAYTDYLIQKDEAVQALVRFLEQS